MASTQAHELSHEKGMDPTGEMNHIEKDERDIQDVQHMDIGAKWLHTYDGPRPEITDALSTQVRWRIDMFLIPVVVMIYFTQQLDKSSLSFASVFDLIQNANLVGTQYSWLGSIVYFAQLVLQPISVYALVRFPVNYWICGCFLGWGASCCIMSAFTSFSGLAAFRFILGGFEASIAPSMMIIVAMWWTRREQPLRNNIWYSANGIATILGSLITWGVGHAQTSLYQYQLIFLVCGVIAVFLCIPTFFILPGHPVRAKWLTPEQKYIALERIRLNNTGTQTTEFKWYQVREAFLDPKSWGWCIIIFCISGVSGGVGTFNGLILKGFGLDSFQTILYGMIPGSIQIVCNILTAILMMKFRMKSPVLLAVSVFPIAGAAGLWILPKDPSYKSDNLAVYFILQVFGCLTPGIISWAFANTAGHTKKTCTTGIIYIGLTTGNIAGPFFYLSSEAPTYHSGLTANLVLLCVMSGTICLQAFYLHTLNRKNIKRRIAQGKTGKVMDLSLQAASKWEQLRAENAKESEIEGLAQVRNAQAFADLTDKENPDFIYSL